MNQEKNLPVLLMLESDDDDRTITRNLFEEEQHPVEIIFARSSEELSRQLQKVSPSLILLSRQSGAVSEMDVLKKLKSDPGSSHIPVVVLGGALSAENVREYYAQGASSFIRKPAGAEASQKKIASFIRYWFETVELA